MRARFIFAPSCVRKRIGQLRNKGPGGGATDESFQTLQKDLKRSSRRTFKRYGCNSDLVRGQDSDNNARVMSATLQGVRDNVGCCIRKGVNHLDLRTSMCRMSDRHRGKLECMS